MRRECPNQFVIANIDQMDTVLLIKLQIANRKERFGRTVRSGALILYGIFLSLSFSVIYPNFFHLVNKTKSRLVGSIIK